MSAPDKDEQPHFSDLDVELMKESLTHSDPLMLKILSIVTSTQTQVTEIDRKISLHENRTEDLAREVETLKETISSMQNELKNFHKNSRINNILLHGLEDTPDINRILLKSVLSTLQIIDASIRAEHISSARRLGRTTGKRPVIITLVSQFWKSSLFENVGVLKDTGLAISNDLLPEEQKEKTQLLALRPNLREQGIVFKMRDTYMIINGKRFTAAEVRRELGLPDSTQADPTSAAPMPARPFHPSNLKQKRARKLAILGTPQSTKRSHDFFS